MTGKKGGQKGPRGSYDKPLALDMDFEEALERFAQADPEETKEEAAKGQALRLVQREEGGPSFLIYATDRGIKTELRFDGDAPWFTQAQLAEIFGSSVPNVNEHIANFLSSGELDEATFRKFRTVRSEGGREVAREILHYGLDVAFYVGYRVNSAQGVLFRRWATDVLIQIAKHGYYMDVERLKEPAAVGIIDKVRSELYEVRAASTNAYREVRRIVSQCSDYDGKDVARAFYARMENKMLYAATGRTAPELILERADAAQDQMGLTYWTGKNGPIQKDVIVGNNYLYQDEAERKNRVTVMLLDYFIDQSDQGKLVTLAECEEKLNGFIKFNQWDLLAGAGSKKRDDADEYAKEELRLFKLGLTRDSSPPQLPKPRKK
jgi:hypothetical protein